LNIGNPGMAFCYEHSNVRNRPQSDKKNERWRIVPAWAWTWASTWACVTSAPRRRR
jgi:hypothetical protein